jgi:hypothetical protein
MSTDHKSGASPGLANTRGDGLQLPVRASEDPCWRRGAEAKTRGYVS